MCYFNVKTGEIIAIPDSSEFIDEYIFKESFQEQLDAIEDKKADLLK
ncbi:hypothetical protein [Formosa algae]|uniref:Uncharacterized protein n=1 Tax=Formosa algae TaxID=225843 RepID=A0A9X0YL94_9FLAO|nr:hypothetical protein [Formosa algae]MBP1840671.1 hypothetical protein [Formosa algae]MDQ0335916.1 hypothetical protein [Formosa algae]